MNLSEAADVNSTVAAPSFTACYLGPPRPDGWTGKVPPGLCPCIGVVAVAVAPVVSHHLASSISPKQGGWSVSTQATSLRSGWDAACTGTYCVGSPNSLLLGNGR